MPTWQSTRLTAVYAHEPRHQRPSHEALNVHQAENWSFPCYTGKPDVVLSATYATSHSLVDQSAGAPSGTRQQFMLLGTDANFPANRETPVKCGLKDKQEARRPKRQVGNLREMAACILALPVHSAVIALASIESFG